MSKLGYHSTPSAPIFVVRRWASLCAMRPRVECCTPLNGPSPYPCGTRRTITVPDRHGYNHVAFVHFSLKPNGYSSARRRALLDSHPMRRPLRACRQRGLAVRADRRINHDLLCPPAVGHRGICRYLDEMRRSVETRLIIAYSLIAVLAFAATAGLVAWRNSSKRRRRRYRRDGR